MPDKWDQYAQPAQQGDKWEQYAQPPTQPPPATPAQPSLLQKTLTGVGNFGKGIAKGAVGTMANTDDLVRKIPGIGEFLTTPITGTPADQAIAHAHQLAEPHTLGQTLGKGTEQAAEFLIPGAGEEKGAAALASLAPKLGKAALPLAKVLTAGAGSGLVNKAQGGDFSTGAALGAGGQVVGQGLKAVAPGIAEGALKVRGNQRLFGRTVGEAILNDTSGIRPGTVGKTAGAKIAELEPELNAADQASAALGKRGTLAPARQSVSDKIAGHTANRAMGTAADLQPVSDFLKTDQLTHLPLAEKQSAPGLRSIKRGLNSDFIGNWTPTQPPAQKAAARQAYGLINSELHGISPETEGLDQRISSLVPVTKQGESVAAGAPTAQRVLGRFGAHTGALTLGTAGAYEGHKEGGLPGAIVGGLTGVVAPELIASPEGQMILARTLHGANGLRPAVGSALQFDRKKAK